MRVLHITPLHFGTSGYFGGGERYVNNLVRALNLYESARIRAEVVCFYKRGTELPSDHELDAPILFLPNDAEGGPFDASSRDLWGAISEADLIHVHQPFSRTGTVALLAAKQSLRPVIVTDSGFDNTASMLTKWNGLGLADRIICISEFSASFFRPHAAATPVDVVSGPVDTDFFRASSRTPRKRHQALCVARILPHKGIDLILKALPANLDLVICGHIYNAEYYDSLQRLAVGKSVTFVVDADDARVRELYESSLITILASQYVDCYGNHYSKPELMGLTLLESMSMGTPVICSRVGGMPELISGPETGLTFDSIDELRAILESVARGDWPEPCSSSACVAHVTENFAFPIVARKLTEIYSNTVSSASQ